MVDLAWTVLEAAAAAGQIGRSSSSSSSDRSLWDWHISAAVSLAAGFGRALEVAHVSSSAREQWLQHAQQFASDTLLKLLMVPAGIFVGQLHNKQHQQQQQQQQQGQGQVLVQPYHQQLLSELGVTPNEHQSPVADQYSAFNTCAALAFTVDLRAVVLRDSSSSTGSSSSGSGSERSCAAGTAAQPAAAAAVPGISSRLYELMLLTALEYAVLVSSADAWCQVHALVVCVDLYRTGLKASSSTAASAAISSPQASLSASDALLHSLLLEVTPALQHSTRCASVADSQWLASVAATSGSDVTAAAKAVLAGSWRSLAALSEAVLHAGELLINTLLM
jgi:hypothetical protein